LGVLGGAFIGGFASASPVGRLGLASLLGQAKEFTRRALCCLYCFYSFVFKKPSFILAVVFLFKLFALPALNSLKTKKQGQNFWWAQKFCPTLLYYSKEKGASFLG